MSARRRWFLPAVLFCLALSSMGVSPAFADDEKQPAESPEKPAELVRAPMMWVVEGDTKVYLVGTIHISEPRVHALLPEVEAAFTKSDAVFTELAFDSASMGELQMTFMTMGILPPDTNLKQVLGEELHDQAGKYMPAMAPIAFLANRKPWVIWFLLLQAQMQASLEKMNEARAAEEKAAGDPDEGATGSSESEPAAPAAPAAPEKPLDWVLFERAAEAGKQVGGLETAKQQLSIFDNLPLEAQIAMVKVAVETLEDLKGEKKKEDNGDDEDGDEGEDDDEIDVGKAVVEQLTLMVNAWLTGDAEALAEMVKGEFSGNEDAEAFGRAMFDTRNVGMVEKICEMIKTDPSKTYFVAVGSGHYPGENGIVKMLEAKGYKVRKVKTGDKIETSKKKEPVKEPAGAGAGG